MGESDVVASFGEQWRRWRTTQLDSVNGSHASRDRLLTCSGWSPGELAGARVLDVGCGAGRFTEVLLALGANVTAVDASTAVEVCLENASNHERLCAVQADLHALPFERGSFDRVLCYGVLQHTPDPGRAFARLVPLLRPGGAIAIDVYLRSLWIHRWTAKYWYRPLTRRLPRDLVRAIVEWYVPRWIPIDRALARVPLFGHVAAALVPCPLVLSTLQGAAPEVQVGWAVLDTFDALTAWHDHPQTVVAVRSWFRKAGLENVDVRVGGNGIVGNGVMPEVAAA